MFQNVADEEISAADSASFIIAQMTAFGIEAENAQHIIDAVNETSNQFSVSSADLANSLGNMSAAMAAGNVTFEEGLGLIDRPSKNSLIDGEPLRVLYTNLIW